MTRPRPYMRAILLALALPLLASASTRSTIPARYVGDWASSIERCAPGPANIENIRVTPRLIHEFETRSAVRSVEIAGKNRLLIAVRVTYQSGESHDTGMRLALADGGATLVVGEGEDTGHYVRCKR